MRLAANLVNKLSRKLNRVAGVSIEEVIVYTVRNDQTIASLPPPAGLEVLGLQSSQIVDISRRSAASDLPTICLPPEGAHTCYGGMIGGELVHYSWVQTSGQHLILEAGRTTSIDADQFWIYDCYTSASARGLGIYPYVLSVIVRDHFQRGWPTGVIYTTEKNKASQRGILKVGFQPAQRYRALRVGRRYIPLKASLTA